MKIHFLGADQTVTGSQHLIEINGHRLLLDCGLFQGHREESFKLNRTSHVDPKSIDAVLLSHAHIDHSGNLPNLVKNGYEGPIYATEATTELATMMLLDSGHIQEADAQYLNKKRRKKGLPPVEPLYTQQDADQVKWLFKEKRFDENFEPIPGVTAHFVKNGHILGATAIVLDYKENGTTRRLWFSGDIGRVGQPLLPDPVMPDHVDYLMMECTYGDKSHHDPHVAYDEFRQVVKETVKRGGKVIIPSFAVGRTQDLVYHLNRMVTHGDIPSIPVYVDSPLAVNASDIFRKYAHTFDDEAKQFVREGNHPALVFDRLIYTRSVEESKSINEQKGPLVIISASGMAETGRILHHLKNNIEDPRNTILIVSWQAPNTLGRRLAERETEVNIFGEIYQVKAQIATIGGLSAHAGQDMLIRYAQSTQSTLKELVLIHGEPKGAIPLTTKLQDIGIQNIHYPEFLDTLEFD